MSAAICIFRVPGKLHISALSSCELTIDVRLGMDSPECAPNEHPERMKPRVPLPTHLQARPFSIEEGAAAGLGRGRLQGKDLRRPYRSVRMPAGSGLSVEELAAAYQSKMPGGAFFCGITAAVIMAIPLPGALESSRVLHVAVASPRHPPTGKGIRGHVFQVNGAHIRLWHGLRLSMPERVFCEIAPLLSLPDLVAVGDFLIRRDLPFTSLDELKAAVEMFPGRRGHPIMDAALPLLSSRSESRQESRLRVIVLSGGLTGLVVNLPITTTGGHRYRADLAFPASRTIIEYQSDYHREPERFRKDMTRISRLQADGWFVMQVNGDDLRNPVELMHRIRAVLAGRPARS